MSMRVSLRNNPHNDKKLSNAYATFVFTKYNPKFNAKLMDIFTKPYIISTTGVKVTTKYIF